MPDLEIKRDFIQVKYAFRIRRLTRLRFELECVWIRFKTEWCGQWTLLERLGAVNPDGSFAWMTGCTLDGTVSWQRPTPGTVYEVPAPAGELDGHETGGNVCKTASSPRQKAFVKAERNRVRKDPKKRKPKRVYKELTLELNDRAIIGDKIVSIRPLRGRASRFRIKVEELTPEDSGVD